MTTTDGSAKDKFESEEAIGGVYRTGSDDWDPWTIDGTRSGPKIQRFYEIQRLNDLKGSAKAQDEYESELFAFPENGFADGAAFEAEEDVEPHWLIHGDVIKVGLSLEENDLPTVMSLVGESGAGKTTLALDLMRCACDHDWWGGQPVGVVPLVGSLVSMDQGKRVLLANLEMSKSLLRSRFIRPLGIKNKDRYVPVTLPATVPIMSDAGRDWWVEELQRANAGLWIVDSYAIIANGGDENDSNDVTRIIHRLREIAGAVGCAVLILDHTGWSAKERVRGSIAKRDRVDVMFVYEFADPEDVNGSRMLTIAKTRWSDNQGATIRVDKDPVTNHHTFTGGGGRAELREEAAERKKAETAAKAKAERHARWMEQLQELYRSYPDGGWASIRDLARCLRNEDGEPRNNLGPAEKEAWFDDGEIGLLKFAPPAASGTKKGRFTAGPIVWSVDRIPAGWLA